jgi:hypothetical protein
LASLCGIYGYYMENERSMVVGELSVLKRFCFAVVI